LAATSFSAAAAEYTAGAGVGVATGLGAYVQEPFICCQELPVELDELLDEAVDELEEVLGLETELPEELAAAKLAALKLPLGL
jgi:hypothetical protein